MATAQNSSSIISSIYKSRKTILELMQKQDYKVEDYNEFSINEVNTMYQNNQLDMLLEKNEENEETHRKKKTYIRYYLSAKLSGSDIQNMIDNLPDGYKMVFNLYAIEGYKHQEIAEMLKINEGTSKSQLSHARKLLQHQITELKKKLNGTT